MVHLRGRLLNSVCQVRGQVDRKPNEDTDGLHCDHPVRVAEKSGHLLRSASRMVRDQARHSRAAATARQPDHLSRHSSPKAEREDSAAGHTDREASASWRARRRPPRSEGGGGPIEFLNPRKFLEEMVY